MRSNGFAACLLLAVTAAPALSQDAGLLAIPDRLNRPAAVEPPPNMGSKLKDTPAVPIESIPNHRELMRDMVIGLSDYARGRNADFVVVVRGGAELLRKSPREALWERLRNPEAAEGGAVAPEGTPQRRYIKALDGIIIDGLYCGEAAKQHKEVMESVRPLLDEGRRLLSIDFCKGDASAKAAKQAATDKALAFLGSDPRMATIPARPATENAASYTNLTLARNIGFALASEPYDTRAEWVMKLQATNHDVLVIPPFHRGSEPLTPADVASLKYKRLGSRRVLLAHLPLASIRDTHFHFKKEWTLGNPPFLAAPDPALPGGYLVDYWDPTWKELVGLSLKGVIDLGFDGVVLDNAGAFARPEQAMPLAPIRKDGADDS